MKTKKLIKVTFRRRSATNEAPTETLTINWIIKNTPIAQKYFEAIKIAAKTGYIYRRDRIYNFPNDYFTRQHIVDGLNASINTVNTYSPGSIPDKAYLEMTQDKMNALHVYFEKLRGPMTASNPFYLNAPKKVKEALDEMNLLIHRYEDCGYCGGTRLLMPKIHFTFGLNEIVKRYPFADEDFQHFSFKRLFGTWLINYCEVGKPLHDLWTDRDIHIGSEVIRPLQFYSADGVVYFYPECTQEQSDKRIAEFYEWWDQNREHLEGLGFKKFDPKNSLGAIPVAELERDAGPLANLDDRQIIDLISKYQWLDSVETIEVSSPAYDEMPGTLVSQ